MDANRQKVNFEKLRHDIQREISHEYNKGLTYIINKATETLDGLDSDQIGLREKQSEIIAAAEMLKQHAINIMALHDPQPAELKKDLVNYRQVVESVLIDLYPYAESQGVTLRTSLQDFEPIFLDTGLTMLSIRNLVHNAIKYSPRGRLVEINLSYDSSATPSSNVAVLTVTDHGRGIPKANWERIFEPDTREDGQVETGNGLGLYIACRAANRQGGNVTLVSSIPNEGSVFRLSLPVTPIGEKAQQARLPQKRTRRLRLDWRWALVIAGILVVLALLWVVFQSPSPTKVVSILSFHNRYVTALGEENSWVLSQETEQSQCSQYAMIQVGDKVALQTCTGRYVSAPSMPNLKPLTTDHDPLWLLRQDADQSDCTLFELVKLGDDQVALRTCADMFVTAGDSGWPGMMAWRLVAETSRFDNWEKFKIIEQP